MTLSKVWTKEKPLFMTIKQRMRLVMSLTLLLLVVMSFGCAGDGDGNTGPQEVEVPIDPNGDIALPEGPVEILELDEIPDNIQPYTCPPPCQQPAPQHLYSYQFFYGYYLARQQYWGAGAGMPESYLYVNGQGFYVGHQTNAAVYNLLHSLAPGWYRISLTGMVGYESGHAPFYSATYPVIHINETF